MELLGNLWLLIILAIPYVLGVITLAAIVGWIENKTPINPYMVWGPLIVVALIVFH